MSQEPNGSQLVEGENTTANVASDQPTAPTKPSFITGEPSAPQTESQPGQSSAEPNGSQVEEFVLPEKFQGKDVLDVAKSYAEVEKTLGRTAQNLGKEKESRMRLEQRVRDLEALIEKAGSVTQGQTPEENSEQGQGLEGDLNELFYTQGADVVRQVVRETMLGVMQEQQAQQRKQNDDFMSQRDNEIATIALSELEVIATEKGEPIPQAVLQQIDYIDRTDPELARLRSDINLTPEVVRQKAREVYERAVKDIQEVARRSSGEPSPEELEAFRKAQRLAASGSPTDTATSPRKPAESEEDPKVAYMKKLGWGFLAQKNSEVAG